MRRIGSAQVAALVVLLLFGWLVWFVMRSAVDAPFMDEWYVWPAILRALDAHTVSWPFLFSPYNGHRIAFVRLLLLALLPTGWSIYPQVAFTLLVSAVALVVVWRLYRRTAGELGLSPDPWAAVVLAAVVFSASDMNRLWGMGHQWHLVAMGSMWTLALLSARPFRWWRLGLAALAAGIATISTGAGLLAWPLGLAMLWVATRDAPSRRPALWCWSAVSAAVWLAYFHGLEDVGGGRSLRPALAHPMVVAQYVLTYLGMPIQVYFDFTLMLCLGVVAVVLGALTALALHRRMRGQLAPLAPWLGVAAFAVSGGVMIGMARLGDHVALYHITTARLFWIALLGAWCLLLARPLRADGPRGWAAARRWGMPALVVAALALNVREHQVGAETWWLPRRALLQAVAFDAPDVCAGNYDVANWITYPPDAIRGSYGVLARHGLAFTRGPDLAHLAVVNPSAPGSGGAVEEAVREPPAPDGGPSCVRLSGWAMDPGGGLPGEVVLVREGRILKRGAVLRQPFQIGAIPPDPGKGLGRWSIFLTTERWPEDSTGLEVYAVARQGKAAYRLETRPGLELPAGRATR